jgi:hypothetical protein
VVKAWLRTGAAWLLATATVAWAAEPLIINGDFEQGLEGWKLVPGEPAMVSVGSVAGAQGSAVRLRAQGATLGLDSELLILGQQLDPTKAYEVSARLKFGGLESGIAAFSICVLDAAGKRLVQYAVQSWRTDSAPHDWVQRATRFGPGTDKAYPAGAHAIHLRLSFHEPSGKCTGEAWMDEVRISAQEPGKFAGWPASILVRSQDLEVRFESRSFWTLYRIDYQGTRVCMDVFGSHYGSVASVKGTGLIGSGHTENGETEQVDDLALEVNGVREVLPKDSYTADRVALRKRSRIRDLVLDTTITVKDNRIDEEVVLAAEKPVALNLLYHFMHPWVPAMSHFLAERLDGQRVEGRFVDDKSMKVSAPVRWSAVFSETLGKGAVTAVLEVPAELPWEVRYWDMPERYRKHYFVVFSNATVEPGRTWRYRVVTQPFAAAPEAWQRLAADLARSLLTPP